MRIMMTYAVDENGWPQPLHDPDLWRMTPAQRVTIDAFRSRTEARQRSIIEAFREAEALATIRLLQEEAG